MPDVLCANQQFPECKHPRVRHTSDPQGFCESCPEENPCTDFISPADTVSVTLHDLPPPPPLHEPWRLLGKGETTSGGAYMELRLGARRKPEPTFTSDKRPFNTTSVTVEVPKPPQGKEWDTVPKYGHGLDVILTLKDKPEPPRVPVMLTREDVRSYAKADWQIAQDIPESARYTRLIQACRDAEAAAQQPVIDRDPEGISAAATTRDAPVCGKSICHFTGVEGGFDEPNRCHGRPLVPCQRIPGHAGGAQPGEALMPIPERYCFCGHIQTCHKKTTRNALLHILCEVLLSGLLSPRAAWGRCEHCACRDFHFRGEFRSNAQS